MAQNARMSRIASKDDESTFCWKIFTGLLEITVWLCICLLTGKINFPGWDYMIGNSETAYNKVASLVMGLKESILEEKERKKDDRNWKLIGLRVFSNFL